MIILIFFVAFVGVSIAGEGGSVYLINLSGSDWKLTHRQSEYMNDWAFPDYLKNGDTARVYVEYTFFSRFAFARVDYELLGTGGMSFQIYALGNPLYILDYKLEVVYNNLEIDGQPKGMSRNLGWRHDGDTNFIIIGRNGKYTGTSLDASNWMRNNIDWLGGRTLRQISIPGSHDAGMSKLDGNTAFGRECNVLTQSNSLGEQLKLGVRYFDIRPVIGNGGKYLTGHYTYVDKYDLIHTWQGGNGQSIASIITDLNDFTKNHNELIIIKLSHTLNTDVGNKSYRKFNQSEWENLFQQLDTINFLYNNTDSKVNLTEIKLGEYTNDGSRAAVVIFVNESNVELGSRTGKGYFMPRNLDMFDDYSNTPDWFFMINDQTGKMHVNSSSIYFLLSWTLTQTDAQSVLCDKTIKDLAEEANIHLGSFLYKEVSSSSYPNIILVDNVKDTDVAAMALAISAKIIKPMNEQIY